MQDLPVFLAIAGFTVMGIVATAKPAFVKTRFGNLELTAAGRNEVRASKAASTFSGHSRCRWPLDDLSIVTVPPIQPRGQP
jgi:hypothetical protein